jgi:hypothetical protein
MLPPLQQLESSLPPLLKASAKIANELKILGEISKKKLDLNDFK